MQLLRKCFNSWFDVVLERRLQLGKARAVSDWKCLFRAWNAWRHFTREQTLERMKQHHENSMIEDHRKLHQSAAHYETRILKKYFLQWQIWLTQQRQAKELEQDQRSVRDKMSAFLETGKKLALEQKQRKEEEERTSSRLANTTVVRYVLYTDIHISGSIHVFLRMLRSTKICCEEVREGFVPNIPTLVKAFSMLYQSG